MDAETALAELRSMADATRTPGMARVGIDVSNALGVSVPSIRAVAKSCGTDHALAIGLWRTGSTRPGSSRRSSPIREH